jgi:very-short-patch-repair endonuclease
MLKDIAPKARPNATANARCLRRKMSLPEVLLWQALRKQPSRLKIRRQHPSGPFILDFFCCDGRLAIEIDGEAHSRGGRPGRDMARDQWLIRAGIATLRIPARDVLSNLDGVVTYIVEQAKARLPLHHPSGGPPPRGKLGEE